MYLWNDQFNDRLGALLSSQVCSNNFAFHCYMYIFNNLYRFLPPVPLIMSVIGVGVTQWVNFVWKRSQMMHQITSLCERAQSLQQDAWANTQTKLKIKHQHWKRWFSDSTFVKLLLDYIMMVIFSTCRVTVFPPQTHCWYVKMLN